MMIPDIFFNNYLAIFIFITIAIFLSLIIIVLPTFMAKAKPEKAKLSPYECGFEPIDTSSKTFDVRFYLIAILFIIFDLEVTFLIPWALHFKYIDSLGFWSMMFFIFILTIGFIYEWKKGALELD